MNVLFLCTGNSCRSLIGEATFNHLAPEGLHAISAGSKPLGRLNAGALALLEREGISTEGYFSKSWNDLPVTPDIVLSVCGNAANETCPVYLSHVMGSHWGVEDPAHAEGTEEEVKAAFMTAYKILRHRIEQFLALPLTELKNDPVRLKAELDRIGTLIP
ncbi:MAG: arsenate reductase ArsC [Methylococcales bacterium]|nr:MAG: arsenate reductase ArsC [Methylococcales bacterium]